MRTATAYRHMHNILTGVGKQRIEYIQLSTNKHRRDEGDKKRVEDQRTCYLEEDECKASDIAAYMRTYSSLPGSTCGPSSLSSAFFDRFGALGALAFGALPRLGFSGASLQRPPIYDTCKYACNAVLKEI